MITTTQKKTFVSVNEAAKIMGCTTGRIRQLLIEGRLPGQKLHERAWAVEKAFLEAYAKKPRKTGRPRISEIS